MSRWTKPFSSASIATPSNGSGDEDSPDATTSFCHVQQVLPHALSQVPQETAEPDDDEDEDEEEDEEEEAEPDDDEDDEPPLDVEELEDVPAELLTACEEPDDTPLDDELDEVESSPVCEPEQPAAVTSRHNLNIPRIITS